MNNVFQLPRPNRPLNKYRVMIYPHPGFCTIRTLFAPNETVLESALKIQYPSLNSWEILREDVA